MAGTILYFSIYDWLVIDSHQYELDEDSKRRQIWTRCEPTNKPYKHHMKNTPILQQRYQATLLCSVWICMQFPFKFFEK